MKRVYIFGAHSRAKTLGVYLKKLYKDIQIMAYLVNNDECNPDNVDGVPVIHTGEDSLLDTECAVYLGIRGVYHADITKALNKLGLSIVIPMTPELDMQLRNDYLNIYYSECGRSFKKIGRNGQDTRVYVIKSAFDNPLQTEYMLKSYEYELQVGASLTDIRVASVTDDKGLNISDRNKQFCELTGLYWIWRNSEADIVGLEHYRRHFLLDTGWEDEFCAGKLDVILPTPLYVMPSIAGNYRERHVQEDWDYMMEYISIMYPEYYPAAVDFFENTNLYSPCNMFIMRRHILDEFCRWMFPIVLACAEHSGVREDSYQNRYPGMLAERLLTFFFEYNRNRFNIVYADKNFLS